MFYRIVFDQGMHQARNRKPSANEDLVRKSAGRQAIESKSIKASFVRMLPR